jgi:hypothetical protein
MTDSGARATSDSEHSPTRAPAKKPRKPRAAQNSSEAGAEAQASAGRSTIWWSHAGIIALTFVLPLLVMQALGLLPMHTPVAFIDVPWRVWVGDLGFITHAWHDRAVLPIRLLLVWLWLAGAGRALRHDTTPGGMERALWLLVLSAPFAWALDRPQVLLALVPSAWAIAAVRRGRPDLAFVACAAAGMIDPLAWTTALPIADESLRNRPAREATDTRIGVAVMTAAGIAAFGIVLRLFGADPMTPWALQGGMPLGGTAWLQTAAHAPWRVWVVPALLAVQWLTLVVLGFAAARRGLVLHAIVVLMLGLACGRPSDALAWAWWPALAGGAWLDRNRSADAVLFVTGALLCVLAFMPVEIGP